MSMPFHANDLAAEVPRLRRYARVLTGDPEIADCLVEEALLRFQRNAGDGEPQSARSLELMALLRDVAGEKAPSGKHPSFSSAASSGSAKSPVDRAGATSLPDDAAEMFARVGELPAEQREVLLLAAVERLPYSDIAALLRIPVAAVVSRLAAAREALHAAGRKAQPAPNNAR
jgi:RNA polymerase sigma-70 factor (ECF subfamily)